MFDKMEFGNGEVWYYSRQLHHPKSAVYPHEVTVSLKMATETEEERSMKTFRTDDPGMLPELAISHLLRVTEGLSKFKVEIDASTTCNGSMVKSLLSALFLFMWDADTRGVNAG